MPYTDEEKKRISDDLAGLRQETREYIEHVIGNRLLVVQHHASPRIRERHCEQLVDDLVEVGFWPVRKMLGQGGCRG